MRAPASTSSAAASAEPRRSGTGTAFAASARSEYVAARKDEAQEAEAREAAKRRVAQSGVGGASGAAGDRADRAASVAWITGISYRATARHLAQFLEAQLPGLEQPVRCVDMKWDERQQRSRGKAQVQLASPAALERVLQISRANGLIFFDRRLTAERSRNAHQWDLLQVEDGGAQGGRYGTPRQPFLVSQFDLGHMPSTGSAGIKSEDGAPFASRWTAGKGEVRFSTEAKPRLEILLLDVVSPLIADGAEDGAAPGVTFKVSIKLKHVRTAVLAAQGSEARVLLLETSAVPHMFQLSHRRAAPASDGAVGGGAGTSALPADTSRLMRNAVKNEMLWSLNPGALDKWERSPDPLGPLCSSGFGTHLSYRCVMAFAPGSREDGDLLRGLRRHGVIAIKSEPGSSAVTSQPAPGADHADAGWSGGYDAAFARMPWVHAYAVHALVSDNALCLRSAADAERIAADGLDATVANLPYPARCFAKECKASVDSDHSRRVILTPLRVCPMPPEPESGNRIYRQFAAYADRFLRVTLAEESFSSARRLKSAKDVLVPRMLRMLQHEGILVAGRRFMFLGYSGSQLKEQSAWMYAEGDGAPAAAAIRACIGDLSNVVGVGKYAARFGQGFTTATPTVNVAAAHTVTIPDVEVQTLALVDGQHVPRRYCFSDGVGMISESLAGRMMAALGRKSNRIASAFQVRFAGCKGVVSVAPKGLMPPGKHLALRPSMVKFQGSSEHRNLEVVSTATEHKCFLNRQVILVLLANGILESDISALFDAAIHSIQLATHDDGACRAVLSSALPRGHAALAMLDAGFSVREEPFLYSLTLAACARCVADLQLRARMHVRDAASLIGILDETQRLDAGTIFFQLLDKRGQPYHPVPPGSWVAVYRNPSLHPGDVRVLESVHEEALAHLCNVAVFPARGSRPHPDEMAGGDLDGDLYCIIWAEALVPPQHSHPADPPATTTTTTTPAAARHGSAAAVPTTNPATIRGGDVTPAMVAEFFVNYLRHDNLGYLCNAHMAFADKPEDAAARCEGVRSDTCRSLAALASLAVDFPKSGVPADVPPALRQELSRMRHPDFMGDRDGTRTTYPSHRLLGRLYRRALDVVTELDSRPTTRSRWALDFRLLVDGYERHMAEARSFVDMYNNDLWKIVYKHELRGEGEALSGCAARYSRKFSRGDRRKDVHDAQQAVRGEVAALQASFRDWFWEGLAGPDSARDPGCLAARQKAAAWYTATYEQAEVDQKIFSDAYFSFAWIVVDVLCHIAKHG